MKRAITLLLLAVLGATCAQANLIIHRRTVAYTAGTAVYDGTNDRIEIIGSPTGLADGGVFSFSFWYHDDGGDGTQRELVEWATSSAAYRLRIEHTTANKIMVQARDSTPTVILQVTSTNTITTASGWVRISGCFNLSNTSLRKLYFGTTAETLSVTTYTNGSIDMAGASWKYDVGTTTNGVLDITGALSEFWFDDSYLDDPTKFESGGHPISLGSDGSLPTGSQPVFYLKGDGNGWNINSGTGGNFTLTGSFGTTTPP